jgi:hypothetical protein
MPRHDGVFGCDDGFVLSGAAGIVAAAAIGGAQLVDRRGVDVTVPAAALGDERLEQRRSAARGRTVDFYTCVPAGHGDGRGLPVCLVLHGGSKTARDFPSLGLGRHLTAAVTAGAAPFVLAGVIGDRLAWRPSGADDPQRMAHEEIPHWCADRLPEAPAAGGYTGGRHNFGYWSTVVPAAFAFITAAW